MAEETWATVSCPPELQDKAFRDALPILGWPEELQIRALWRPTLLCECIDAQLRLNRARVIANLKWEELKDEVLAFHANRGSGHG